jgi:hypothetical protein
VGSTRRGYLNLFSSVKPGAPVFDLGDLSRLQVETKDLIKMDMAKLTLGQTASLTCDALPGKTLN